MSEDFPQDDFDRRLRALARAARGEASTLLDARAIEQSLTEVSSGSQLARLRPAAPAPERRRMLPWLSIAAAVVLIAGGAIWLTGHEDRVRVVDPPLTAPVASTVPASSSPEVAPVAPTAPGRTVTTSSAPPPSSAVETVSSVVRHTDDLPIAPLVPLGEVALEGGEDWLVAAIGDLGVAVRNGDEPNVHVLAFDGQRRDVPVTEELGAIAYGPGDILYGLRWAAPPDGRAGPAVSTVAIPLSGAQIGQIVAEAPATGGAVGWLETTPSPLAHGPTGIVDRERQIDLELLPYVDVDQLAGGVSEQPRLEGSAIVTASHRFVLQIERELGWVAPFTSPIPAVGAAGSVVYPTTLGAPLEPGDFAEGTQPVLLVAAASGAVTWYSIPDGWAYATSDVWGTVFVRRDGNRLEIALLEVPSDTTPAPTAPPPTSTAPTSTAPAATAVPPAADALLDGLYHEYAGIRNACLADGPCTQIVFDPSGAPVSYDPRTRTVTRHLRDTGGPAQFTVNGPESVGLVAAGPDHVVYLRMPSDDPEVADVVAYSLAAHDAGREIARFPGVLGLGDYDIVPGPDGLVMLGWYGQGVQPTEPYDVVIGWVGSDGQPIASSRPLVRMDFYEHTVVIGERQWSYTDPVDGAFAAMPQITPTFDGGFVSVLHHGVDGRSAVVRGWADGTVETWLPPAGAGAWINVIPDPSGHVLVPHGELVMRAELFPARPQDYWDGSRSTDSEAGTVTAIGLDEYLDANDPWWETDPVGFANAVAGPMSSPAERRTIERRDDAVVVTTEGLLDDSVHGVRWTFHLVDTEDGLRVDRIDAANTCQPGRGHQDYRAERCN